MSQPTPARRVRLAAALLALALAAIAPHTAHAVDKLDLRLDWITEPIHLPFFLAAQRGWFKAADLDVSIEDGTGSTLTVQLVGNGRFDVGVADLSPMAIGESKGMPVVSIAGFIRKGAVGFVVPTEMKIASLRDFVGKTVLYTTSSFEGPLIEPLFRANGVPYDKVTMIHMDASAKIPAYLSGRGDAMITTVPPNIVIAGDKRPSSGVLFSDYGFNFPGFGLFTRQDVLKSRAGAIKRFVSVVCGSWVYILESHEHIVEASRATFAERPRAALPFDTLVAQAEAYRPYFYTASTKDMPVCLQTEADWADAIKGLESAKIIPAGSRPAEYFTNDYIDFAYAKTIIAQP